MALIDKAFGKNASWVVCPRSNSYISGLRPPVEMLRGEGARICIGTDSLASNHSLSMIEEMKPLREVPLRELAAWATANGAEALGIADKKGSIEVGRQSGIVLIEGIERKDDGELYLTESSSARRLA
jgi:cytosine/adenosine deaminase-related metal-dependent hydrolase